MLLETHPQLSANILGDKVVWPRLKLFLLIFFAVWLTYVTFSIDSSSRTRQLRCIQYYQIDRRKLRYSLHCICNHPSPGKGPVSKEVFLCECLRYYYWLKSENNRGSSWEAALVHARYLVVSGLQLDFVLLLICEVIMPCRAQNDNARAETLHTQHNDT